MKLDVNTCDKILFIESHLYKVITYILPAKKDLLNNLRIYVK
jgi:hypothetical protein